MKALLFFEYGEESVTGQELAARFSIFLLNLGAKKASPAEAMSQSAIEYRKIVSYMFDNLEKNLTLSDIASANNVSVSYVKLLFNTYAGLSPKNYYTQLRIRAATDLLHRHYSISRVAEIMNFSSPNYFSTFYRKNTGLSPSDIKKRTHY